MKEIFADISLEMKTLIQSYVNIVLSGNIKKQEIPTLMNDFTNAMPTEYLQEYVEFYFNLKLEELLNGSNYNQR